MKLSAKEYELILENAPNLVWRSGIDGKCNYFNKTWLSFTGNSMAEELGDGWTSGIHPDDLERCLRIYSEAFSQQEIFEMNYRLKRFDGEYRVINDRGGPFYSADGNFLGYIGSCIDVTDKVEGETMREMAIKDSLTAVYNRQYFNILMNKEIQRSKRNKQIFSVMMIDIDKFKVVNDTYGHLVGDQVLIAIVKVLKENTRDYDIIGRFGGDEFMLFLPETNQMGALNIGNRIISYFNKYKLKTLDNEIKIAVSIGISEYNNNQTYDELINNADQAMYLSKKNKNSSVELFSN
jgi:diguanylate cyclase (GGDEF)-like protein/PAS domain S-box-containing protein